MENHKINSTLCELLNLLEQEQTINKYAFEDILELFAQGAEPNARNDETKSILHLAAQKGTPQQITTLLAQGCDPHLETEAMQTPLFYAVLGDLPENITALASHSNLEHKNHAGATAANVAALLGHYECLIILLSHNAAIDTENDFGLRPIDYCVTQIGDTHSEKEILSIITKLLSYKPVLINPHRPDFDILEIAEERLPQEAYIILQKYKTTQEQK